MKRLFAFIFFCNVMMFLAGLLLFIILASEIGHCETIEQKIVKSAKRNGIDPSLALAMAYVETKFDDSKVGSLGEVGVFQLRPEFHRVVAGDTDHNIELAMKYLAKLKLQCREYGDAYFVCYNYGSARKLKFPHKFAYYRKVKLAQKFHSSVRIAQKD